MNWWNKGTFNSHLCCVSTAAAGAVSSQAQAVGGREGGGLCSTDCSSRVSPAAVRLVTVTWLKDK